MSIFSCYTQNCTNLHIIQKLWRTLYCTANDYLPCNDGADLMVAMVGIDALGTAGGGWRGLTMGEEPDGWILEEEAEVESGYLPEDRPRVEGILEDEAEVERGIL